jgi:hypothetical protein
MQRYSADLCTPPVAANPASVLSAFRTALCEYAYTHTRMRLLVCRIVHCAAACVRAVGGSARTAQRCAAVAAAASAVGARCHSQLCRATLRDSCNTCKHVATRYNMFRPGKRPSYNMLQHIARANLGHCTDGRCTLSESLCAEGGSPAAAALPSAARPRHGLYVSTCHIVCCAHNAASGIQRTTWHRG